MSNIVNGINIKNHSYYLFDDFINVKDFDANNIKIDQKSYKNSRIHYISYVTMENSKYVKINSVNHLYLVFNKMNGYIDEEIIENKCLTLVPTNQSKEKKLKSMKKCRLKAET